MRGITLTTVLLATLPLINAVPSVTIRHMEEHMEKRQSTTQLPKMNITAWDVATSTACTTQLTKLNGKSSSPAGMAVCYNLPFLDNSTGLFQADLRLYQISSPTGSFAGVPAQDVTVGLQYFGATVQPLNITAMAMAKREEFDDDYGLGASLKSLSWPVTRDVDADLMNLLVSRQSSVPTLVQSYEFVGQVNKTLFAAITTTQQLQGLVIPIVTLSARTLSNDIVNTTLSADEATFVTGVFSNSLTPTQLAAVAAAASASAAAQQSKLPFKVPGMRILIFPVGGVVTGVWAIALISTIGYGTFGRYQFQQQFRKRSARAMGAPSSGKFYGGL